MRLNDPPIDQGQLELIQDGGDDQRRFHHGKFLPDTYSWAAAKGKVSVLRQTFRKPGGPPLGLENFWIVKESRVPVRDPL